VGIMNLPNMKEARIRTDKEVKVIKKENIKNNIFAGKYYFIKTYGCQMNVHDSEEIKKSLENLGLQETNDVNLATVAILNTCAIRENAHDKTFGFLGRLKHLKKKNNELIIALGGCMPQQENVIEEIITKHPYVDVVFGTHNIANLPKMLLEAQEKQQVEVYSIEGDIYENIEYKRDSNITAWVNIMLGCDKFCTYCIVPFTRGKQRSRQLIDIVSEVKELVKNGYQEITLLGQNVNAYGKDLEVPLSFSELLESVAKTDIPRIRFVTSHPWDFSDELIDVIARYKNVMPFIHLPVQSGSNSILKKMGRRYTKEEYLTLFHKIKERVPNVSITTDIIVGFPNETDNDFKSTLELVLECKFDGAFTFIYSPREGTPAAKMIDNVSLEEKQARLYELNKMINKFSLENNKKILGKTLKVLVLGKSEKDETKVYGYTDTFKLVNIEAKKDVIGKIIDVEITEAKSFSLDGKIKEKVRHDS